jgi:hypothetical protein
VGGFTVNPLRDCIEEDCLFQTLDIEKKGISVYKENSILVHVFDRIMGEIVEIPVAGDVVRLKKDSLNKFFERNKVLFERFENQQMSITEKLLYLRKISRGKRLPRGLVDTDAIGGEEAREEMIGTKEEFERAGRKVQEIGTKEGIELKVTSLLDTVKKIKEGTVRINRESTLRKLAEENKHLYEKLKEFYGEDVPNPVRKYIENIFKSLSQSRE